MLSTYNNTGKSTIHQDATRAAFGDTGQAYNASLYYTPEFEEFTLRYARQWARLAEDWVQHGDTLVLSLETVVQDTRGQLERWIKTFICRKKYL